MHSPLPRLLAALAFTLVAPVLPAASDSTASLTVHADQPGSVINPNLYGQFSEHLGHCIYGGIWVGEDSPIPNTRGIRNDVIAALKELHIPVLRWPGGCFADEYHWRDGVGPRDKRPTLVNTSWGGVTEDNHFGTHEFLDFCELIGAQPYICGNVGSGTVKEMMDWVEYITSDSNSPMANLRRANGRDKPWKLPYFGVGNESWGCGGSMRPEFYADNFRRYNTFVKNTSDNKVYRIASGSNADDVNWTETMMKIATKQMNGLSLHYYTIPEGNWKHKGPATGFGEDEYFSTLKATLQMDGIIAAHSAIMDKYDPEKKVGLIVDEWGVWTDVEPGTNPAFLFQQNSLRDALVAAINLQIFQKHADRVVMANIAQMVNVLQAMILTDNEKMVLTPTYYVFDLLKVHEGATDLPLELTTPDYTFAKEKIPAVSGAASRDPAGKVHLSLVNTDPHTALTVNCSLVGLTTQTVSGQILTAPAINSVNTFASPHVVEPRAFNGATFADGKLSVVLPPMSVVLLTL